MVEGFNMGRECPWTKEELNSLYNKLELYAKSLAVRLLMKEGQKSSMEAFGAYKMFKYPVIYVYLHYHYGTFEDLGMDNADITGYLSLYMTETEQFTKEMLNGLRTSNVFYYDTNNKISPQLESVCEEVLYILRN